jgi:hypothetical protein
VEEDGRELNSEPELLSSSSKDPLLKSDIVAYRRWTDYVLGLEGGFGVAIVRTWIQRPECMLALERTTVYSRIAHYADVCQCRPEGLSVRCT